MTGYHYSPTDSGGWAWRGSNNTPWLCVKHYCVSIGWRSLPINLSRRENDSMCVANVCMYALSIDCGSVWLVPCLIWLILPSRPLWGRKQPEWQWRVYTVISEAHSSVCDSMWCVWPDEMKWHCIWQAIYSPVYIANWKREWGDGIALSVIHLPSELQRLFLEGEWWLSGVTVIDGNPRVLQWAGRADRPHAWWHCWALCVGDVCQVTQWNSLGGKEKKKK